METQIGKVYQEHLPFGRTESLKSAGLDDNDIELIAKIKYTCTWDECPCGE